MKKTFKLTSDTKKTERQIDSVRHEVKKYVKRERRKEFPKGFDCWEFQCKIGKDEDSAEGVVLEEINSKIDLLAQDGNESIYIEILSGPGHRPKKVDDSGL
ncbi:MAG: hypothetical protein KAG61_14225 [Bacteriovoracaceae bacterium]|nr:hypothetical protein [Bacteriovoracaceae bacterium]